MPDFLTSLLPLPNFEEGEVVVTAPGSGPGYWAGAPSAVFVDGTFYLAYRTRLPEGVGRGIGTVVAKSTNGVDFETLFVLSKDTFHAESLERPALVRTPEGIWQLYLSCATPGTKHWWIEVLESEDISQLEHGNRRVVFPGSEAIAVKDPVLQWHDGICHAWITVHPLELSGAEDRMTTAYATSEDTRHWTWHGDVLVPRAGNWDARGARVSDVVVTEDDKVAMFYDGRAHVSQNCEERLGIARGPLAGPFSAIGEAPIVESPHGSGSLRYLSVVPLGASSYRLYYEVSREDGAHDLRTEIVKVG